MRCYIIIDSIGFFDIFVKMLQKNEGCFDLVEEFELNRVADIFFGSGYYVFDSYCEGLRRMRLCIRGPKFVWFNAV